MTRERRAPHPATLVQPKAGDRSSTAREGYTPHPATVAQRREAHPAARPRSAYALVQRALLVAEVDRFIQGDVDPNAVQGQTIVVPGIGGCSSGVVTIDFQNRVHYFAFHEQEATDRMVPDNGWPHEAFAAWWQQVNGGANPRASILYSTATTTIKLINRSGIQLVNERGLSTAYGPKHSTVMVDSFKTITYQMDHSDMTVEDPKHYQGIKTYGEYTAWVKEKYFLPTTKKTSKKDSGCLIC